MHSPPQLSWILGIASMLQYASAQSYQSALIFQGRGLAGSVVDATGCDITYELECTAGTDVCSDVIVSALLMPSPYRFVNVWK